MCLLNLGLGWHVVGPVELGSACSSSTTRCADVVLRDSNHPTTRNRGEHGVGIFNPGLGWHVVGLVDKPAMAHAFLTWSTAASIGFSRALVA
jgi:hypothetical protein